MPNTEIYLIRHGSPEYKYDSEGRKLMYGPQTQMSEEGRAQVRAIAGRLPDFDIIYTSPFVRTRETAEIIALQRGCNPSDVVVSEAFSDLDSPVFNGALLEDVATSRIKRNPEDETDEQIYERVNHEF
jgi:broad specificity phosphatase PhoE